MAGLLEGRSTIVTGGASGIGRATALAFAEEGAKVAIADTDLAGAEETAEMIRAKGGEAYAVECDVTDQAAVDAFVDGVAERWGGIDAAFNNAGISPEDFTVPWGDLGPADLTMDTNYRAVLLCMAAELRHMVKAGKGSIIGTSSIAGQSGNGGAGYCASKHAVIGLTKSAAVKYAPMGIRVNCVCPGVIETGMTAPLIADPQANAFLKTLQPMPRIGQASEIADAVVFLASDKSSFITGHPLVVDGGCLAR
ncbi:SDR family NAD(P)-dependent oxidoreductase [Flavisphingomonas formosensis]|uniref:SDR family NAD(P)-dependent oxidoreductase n=1 Tax=Flavisphingomonas formosensis TaxID=861534 RepID=UPI0012FAE2AC|nr:glucose 1-dehydrogenase [Sphingomonas formosensis]